MTAHGHPPRFAPAVPASAWALCAIYAACGLVAMAWWSPRVPYADAWRHLGRHLAMPFPRDVLASDNGHHELLPNLLRVLELRLLDGGQWLQIAAGMAMAVATVAIAWRVVRRLPHAAARAAGLLAVVAGIFWLGNYRALVHGNESVHAYAVTLFLVIGLWGILRRDDTRGDARAALVASACGLAAAFSFGSGIACFAAFALVLLLRRSMGALVVIAVGFMLALALLRLTGGNGAPLAFSPLRQAELVLRWLGAPPAYAAWPLMDPELASRLPGAALRAPVEMLAQGYREHFGPMLLARWPHLVAGGSGLAAFTWATWRAWAGRGPDKPGSGPVAASLLGLGLAAFALATGGLVALVRLRYFENFPEQVMAPRYLVWSSLFWAGLLLALVAQSRRPVHACALAVAMALLLLPSQAWMGATGVKPLREVADAWALAAAAGVVEGGLPASENIAAEVVATVPAARRGGVAVFAWPEAGMVGRRVAAGAVRLPGVRDLQVHAVDNRLGGAARRVHFRPGAQRCARLLLVDSDSVVRGLAAPLGGPDRWTGWMQGSGMQDSGIQGNAPQPPRVMDCMTPLSSADMRGADTATAVAPALPTTTAPPAGITPD